MKPPGSVTSTELSSARRNRAETGGVKKAVCIDCAAGHQGVRRLARCWEASSATWGLLQDDRLTAAVEAAWS